MARAKKAAKASPDPGRARIEYEPLVWLASRPWENNPKGHDLDFLGEAFATNGFVEPIVFDEGTEKIVAGHGRVEELVALKASGAAPPERIEARADDWYVPVLRGMRLRDPGKHVMASNRGVELGGWDNKALAEMLTGYEGNLLGTGFSPGDFAAFLTLGGEGDDPNAHWKGMPEFDQKDLAPWKSIHVHFKSQKDLEAFAKLVRQPMTPDTRSVWYPAAKIGRTADKVYSG
jgi:hypothetical protein